MDFTPCDKPDNPAASDNGRMTDVGVASAPNSGGQPEATKGMPPAPLSPAATTASWYMTESSIPTPPLSARAARQKQIRDWWVKRPFQDPLAGGEPWSVLRAAYTIGRAGSAFRLTREMLLDAEPSEGFAPTDLHLPLRDLTRPLVMLFRLELPNEPHANLHNAFGQMRWYADVFGRFVESAWRELVPASRRKGRPGGRPWHAFAYWSRRVFPPGTELGDAAALGEAVGALELQCYRDGGLRRVPDGAGCPGLRELVPFTDAGWWPDGMVMMLKVPQVVKLTARNAEETVVLEGPKGSCSIRVKVVNGVPLYVGLTPSWGLTSGGPVSCQDRLQVDTRLGTATLDGTPYRVTLPQAAFLDALVKARGRWQSGPYLARHVAELDGARCDRLRDALVQPLQNIIESGKGKGYKLADDLLE
jgi:hypothetical protein